MDTKHSKPPCEHMKGALNDTADGSAGVVRRLFTALHCWHCGPCRRYLDTLRGMVGRLRGERSKAPDAETLARLAKSLETASEEVTPLP